MGIATLVQVFSISTIFNLTHKEEEVWLDGTHPMFFEESSCVCMPSFMLVDPFLFRANVPFLAYFFNLLKKKKKKKKKNFFFEYRK